MRKQVQTALDMVFTVSEQQMAKLSRLKATMDGPMQRTQLHRNPAPSPRDPFLSERCTTVVFATTCGATYNAQPNRGLAATALTVDLVHAAFLGTAATHCREVHTIGRYGALTAYGASCTSPCGIAAHVSHVSAA